MPRAEDEHPVGDLGPGREHEPFGVSVRARTARRDLHDLDASVSQDRVNDAVNCPARSRTRNRRPVGAITQILQQVADLLHGPRPIWVRGDPDNVHVTAACLHDEQAIPALQGHSAVDVEEVRGEHRRGLRVQELPPGRVGMPFRCRRDLQGLGTRRMVDALTRWPSFSSSPWIRWYPQALFSVASRAISAAISALTGGRPVRCG